MRPLCCNHDHAAAARHGLVFNRALRGDPTRTTALRQKFTADMARRYNLLAAKVRDAVVVKDVFGFKEPNNIFANVESGLAPGAFRFSTAPEKVNGFMKWISSEIDNGVLELMPGASRTVVGNPAWTDTYIQSAYKRGMQRADSEMRKGGLAKMPGALEIDAAFNLPIHADKVGVLYTRVWGELNGAAGRLTQKLQRVLSEELALGMAEGRSPISVARRLVRDIGLERSYAKTLARTEIIRAHHVGNINTMREAGVEGVKVEAEWATAGWNVCPDCEDMEGRVFSLDEIEGLIPFHPNCRCCAVPFQKAMDDVSTVRGEAQIGEEYRRADGSFKKRGLFEKAVQGRFRKPARVRHVAGSQGRKKS